MHPAQPCFAQPGGVRNKLIHSLSMLSFRIFKTLSIPNCKSWGAKILRECSPPTMCHMSCVTCHVYFFMGLTKVVELVGGGSVINGSYPV